jgi:predicted O-methyltransferase YrrM
VKTIEEFAAALAPSSVVLCIGGDELPDRLHRVNPGLRVAHVRPGADDIAAAAFAAIHGRPPADRRTARVHMQLDLILAQAPVGEDVKDDLLDFLHPGGMAVFDGRPERPPTPFPPRVAFAKLTDPEQDALARAVAALPPDSIYVEIGSYKGGSAVLAALANPGIRIYGVDIWTETDNPEIYAPMEEWKRHTQYFNTIRPVKVDLSAPEKGLEMIAEAEGVDPERLEIDFLFIDGDHSVDGVLRDLSVYAPAARKLCGHDFHRGGSVERGVHTYFSRGWKKRFNCAANRLFALPATRRILGGLRRLAPARCPLAPPEIRHHDWPAEHASLWWTDGSIPG